MGTKKHVQIKKRQDKTSDKELNKMEMNNIPEAAFKLLVITLINELRGREVELREQFNKVMKNIKSGM